MSAIIGGGATSSIAAGVGISATTGAAASIPAAGASTAGASPSLTAEPANHVFAFDRSFPTPLSLDGSSETSNAGISIAGGISAATADSDGETAQSGTVAAFAS